MDQTQALATFVENIVKAVGVLSVITMAISVGVTQLLKGAVKKSWLIAVIAVLLGFFGGLTVMQAFNSVTGNHSAFFAPLSVLIGFISAIGGPGLFSVGKTIKNAVSTTTE